MDFQPDIRASKKGQKKVSRYLFIGGFFLLPWLWVVNVLFFAPFLRHPRTPAEVKANVAGSAVGALVFFAGFVAWAVWYSYNWQDLGVTGENLLVDLPKP
eukprot:TRINITY_DN4078_c0_g1_i1.p2 TRINITY_DN4078_c0_g1~~TRINITY_DN4078_c0_g1_i1.p2  ORF type:complete len:100 (+),score=26.03 TRINITY_DN4078_c0_g1_i1:193-492(+)